MDTIMQTTAEGIELITPLGDELLFHGMQAQDELGRPGEYHLDLLSKNKKIDRDSILGARVSIRVVLDNGEIRHFDGFVTRFSKGGGLGRYARYYAVVRPWLWFLTRTSDCRIFQDKDVKQVLEEVFADHDPVADFVFELADQYPTYKYCVQYRETDFNFVSRLLEHEGIYYYFRHTDGHHTMVLTDSIEKHDPCPGYEILQFIPPQIAVKPGVEHIDSWEVTRQVQPGVYAHDDYDFERPNVDLTTTRTLPRPYDPSGYEVYDYPGFYLQKPHGEHYAHVRIDEFGTEFELARATTNHRGVTVGATFDLESHPEENEQFNGKYLVIAATHSLESTQYESGGIDGAAFRCSFTALPCSQQFRPRRLTANPFVQGPQTAVVVGPAGEEIYTDKYGRVKVQFHWDRRGKNDENSSCWIRVSHPWAGKGWGSVATPRIGQEVIVDFLEGDPDQPIVTGRVYNEDNQPPFGFPAGAVTSGIKTRTHKGAGYNEISCDDTAGKEKVTIHAQYDMNTTVEHDQTNTVVSGNRTMTIQSGTLTDVVKGNASLTVQAGSRTVSVTGGDYDASASAAVKLHGKGAGVQITGDAAGVDVKGTGGTGVAVNGTPNVEVTAAALAATEAPVVTVKGTASCGIESPLVTINATATGVLSSPVVDIGDGVITVHGQSIVLTAGGSAIEIGAAGVTINGSTVNVSGGTVNVMGGLVKIN